MTDLTKLSGPRLESLVNTLQIRDRDATRHCCTVGLGHILTRDLPEIAAAGDMPHNRAAREAVDANTAWRAANDELERRRRWHGSNRPIRIQA